MNMSCSNTVAAKDLFMLCMYHLGKESNNQWRFIQQTGLFSQDQNVIFPVAYCVEPGESAWESGVIPAAC